MIWLLFKNCGGKKTKNGSAVVDAGGCNNSPRSVLRELLLELDYGASDGPGDDRPLVTDAHFTCLSVVDPDGARTDGGCGSDDGLADDADTDGEDVTEVIESTNVMRSRAVTDKRLKSLQCPFVWQRTVAADAVDRVQKKYGWYNTANVPTAANFSFERYINNLIISCELFKMNKVDEAHDKITNVWNWLDKLSDTNESFYLAIRDGLKHIVMSTLCHMLYTTNKLKCQQLFDMIARFDGMSSKSRAAVYAVRSAVCAETAGGAAPRWSAAVRYAEKACDLDPNTARWHYLRSVALTGRRQCTTSCKSCPTDAEFDAVQRAAILADRPDPYFNVHRARLMANKLLYRYRRARDDDSPERTREHFGTVVGLVKEVVSMEPEDPHVIVNCAKFMMTLSYFNRENIELAKEIITIAVNMAHGDPTVIEAIKESIAVYKRLVDEHKEMIEKNTDLISIKTMHPPERSNNEDNDLENDLKSVVNKYKEGSNPLLDFINLLRKYDGESSRWEIIAQMCSYAILFSDYSNSLVGIEQFMTLIKDREIATSEIITNHRSVFFRDRSKTINLAELVCNEIKLAITMGHINGPDEIRRHLDHLTEITEMCQLKSKKLDPNLKTELIDHDDRVRTVDSQPTDGPATTSKNTNKRCRVKSASNNRTRVYNSKTKNRNNSRNMWKNIDNSQA